MGNIKVKKNDHVFGEEKDSNEKTLVPWSTYKCGRICNTINSTRQVTYNR